MSIFFRTRLFLINNYDSDAKVYSNERYLQLL